ncbi:cache domain-containing protein, partial [Ensifer sp. 1H6]
MTRILVAASGVVVTAFAGFSVYIDTLQYDTTTKAVEENISSSGVQAAQSVAKWLNGRVTLTAMVADAAGRTTDDNGVQPILKNDVLTNEFISTYVGNESGKFITWPDNPMPAGYDPRQRPWYQQAVKADARVLTEPYVDASTGDLIISAAVPVKRDGKLYGVTGSDFSLETLVSMVKGIDVGGEGFAFLASKDGQILVHPDSKLVTKTLADAFPIDTPTISSGIMNTELDGKPMIVSFVPVQGLPSVEWYVGFVIDADVAYSAIDQFRIAATVATILAVGVMLVFLATFLNRLVIRPVTDMTGAMEKLAAGNLNVEIPGEDRRDQIGSMAAAVAVFRSNAVERARLEDEADANRSLSERERLERQARDARDAAEVQQAVDGLASGLG